MASQHFEEVSGNLIALEENQTDLSEGLGRLRGLRLVGRDVLPEFLKKGPRFFPQPALGGLSEACERQVERFRQGSQLID